MASVFAPAIDPTVADVALQHAVANGVGEGHVPVVARGVLRQFGLKAVQVFDQGCGDRIRSKSGANVRESNRAACVGWGITRDCRPHAFSSSSSV